MHGSQNYLVVTLAQPFEVSVVAERRVTESFLQMQVLAIATDVQTRWLQGGPTQYYLVRLDALTLWARAWTGREEASASSEYWAFGCRDEAGRWVSRVK